MMSVIITPPTRVNTEHPGCLAGGKTRDETVVSHVVFSGDTVMPGSKPLCSIVGVLRDRWWPGPTPATVRSINRQ